MGVATADDDFKAFSANDPHCGKTLALMCCPPIRLHNYGCIRYHLTLRDCVFDCSKITTSVRKLCMIQHQILQN